ncbi:hypothetical protein D3C76_1306290 [compost metagenome]
MFTIESGNDLKNPIILLMNFGTSILAVFINPCTHSTIESFTLDNAFTILSLICVKKSTIFDIKLGISTRIKSFNPFINLINSSIVLFNKVIKYSYKSLKIVVNTPIAIGMSLVKKLNIPLNTL